MKERKKENDERERMKGRKKIKREAYLSKVDRRMFDVHFTKLIS
jgi:hypothetical protein